MTPKPKKDKGIPCFFIQTGVGNVVMRLRRPDTLAGTALTLHQIISLDVPIATIPFFDPAKFKAFYQEEAEERHLNYLLRHDEQEENYLKFGPGMN